MTAHGIRRQSAPRSFLCATLAPRVRFNFYKQGDKGDAMKKLLLIATAVAVVLPAAGAEAAPKPPKPTPTLNMALSRTLVTWGDSVTISGQLAGVAIPANGVTITLQESPFPFKSFKNKATVQTNPVGA